MSNDYVNLEIPEFINTHTRVITIILMISHESSLVVESRLNAKLDCY